LLLAPCYSFEVESALASGVRERLDPPVIEEPAPVEDDLRDPRRLGLGRDRAPHPLRAFGLRHPVAAAELRAQLGIGRSGRDQRVLTHIVNHLRVDVLPGAKDIQSGSLWRPGDLRADAAVAPLSRRERLAYLQSLHGHEIAPPSFRARHRGPVQGEY
jgi:hypothetical protein